MRKLIFGLFLACTLVRPALADGPAAPPRLSSERAVMHTVAGDVVLAFYPDVAPQTVAQILRLMRLGVYDTTHFYRIEPHFVAQLSTALDRRAPLTLDQRNAIQPVPQEFSNQPHRAGVLSMARREEDKNGGETSFSVLLGNAPHLDGKYVVFGEVVSGMEVFEQLEQVPRNGTQPVVRLDVRKIDVYNTPEEVAEHGLVPAHPVPVSAAITAAVKAQSTQGPGGSGAAREVAPGILLMVACGLVGYFFRRRLSESMQVSLDLIIVLVGGFLLLVILVPAAQGHALWELGIFVALIGMLRLMSRFETT